MKKIFQKPPVKEKILFTQEGIDKVKEDQALFKERRKVVITSLQRAREMGDLSENGLYKSAKQEQGYVDSQLRRFEYLLKHAHIVEHMDKDIVQIGATVTVDDGIKERVYTIVGGFESNPTEGKISHHSPIGKALSGKKVGDNVEITIPSGIKIYKIIKIA